MSLQMIQDGEGNNTGVFIPYNEWTKLKKRHKDLADLEPKEPSKEEILESIRKGLKEVDLYKKGKLKATLAKDFLKEL